MMPRALRAVAVAIAVAGAIDPAITAVRPTRPEIALVASDHLPDPTLTDRVAQALDDHFTVIHGSSIGAAATVSVGYQLPGPGARHTPVGFALLPEPRAPFVAITAIESPARVQLQAQAPLTVRLHTMSARGRTLTVTVMNGTVALSHMTRPIESDDTKETVELPVVPTASGNTQYAVTARVDGGVQAVTSHFTLRAGDDRWAVLFFDGRPSWMSTFVRRSAESDPRFVVSSRVRTSRGAAVTSGQAPNSLASLPPLELFHAVVVGAPDVLEATDVAGLESFLRERGGTVIVLMDVRHEGGRPFERLAGVTEWSYVNRPELAGQVLGSEFLSPRTMPVWAMPLGTAGGPGSPVAPAAIWKTPVGRGRVIVSGALDAWRYRDRDAGAFDRFWRFTLANAAAATPPAGTGSDAAPRIDQRLAPDERDLLRAWASSHRGEAIPESRLAELGPALAQRVAAPSERRPFHPMRSAWWLLLFAIAVSGEWWLRRRGGQR